MAAERSFLLWKPKGIELRFQIPLKATEWLHVSGYPYPHDARTLEVRKNANPLPS